MRRSHMFAVICVLVTSVLLTNSSYATKMLNRNAEELAKMADRIFVGVCTSVAERRDGNMIYTEYTFQVLQSIKAAQGQCLFDPAIRTLEDQANGLPVTGPETVLKIRQAQTLGRNPIQRDQKITLPHAGTGGR